MLKQNINFTMYILALCLVSCVSQNNRHSAKDSYTLTSGYLWQKSGYSNPYFKEKSPILINQVSSFERNQLAAPLNYFDISARLTREELTAVRIYTGAGHEYIQACTTSTHLCKAVIPLKPLKEKMEVARNFVSAYAKIPPSKGIIYRGLTMTEENIKEAIDAFQSHRNYSIAQTSWASATTRFEMAKNFASFTPDRYGGDWYSVLLVIANQTARSVEAVSAQAHEEEYIINKDATFQITNIRPIESFYKFVAIELKEVSCQ